MIIIMNLNLPLSCLELFLIINMDTVNNSLRSPAEPDSGSGI